MRKYFVLFCYIIASHAIRAQSDSLDIMIGQMIMIGVGDFNRVNASEPIFEEIRSGKVGGVVLYEKNLFFEAPKTELASMVGELQKNAEVPIFVSIDEEGGYVSRLKTKYGFQKSVSAQYLGQINDTDSTRFYAKRIAQNLSDFGINMNYAPVVDINVNPKNPVIGGIKRSFSGDYHQVIEHSYTVIDEHNNHQVVPVIKHFPGHGSSKSDTHLGLTDVTATWQIEEIYPYAALIDSGLVKAIMTAHIVNQTLDQTKKPATLSDNVISGLLRGLLKYDGVVISDDMQMGAIKNEYGINEAIRMSISAGVDILMFANNVQDYDLVTASHVHQMIKNLVLEGVISKSRIKDSFVRIMKLKGDMGLLAPDYYENLKQQLKRHP